MAPLSYRTNRILGVHKPSKYISIIENRYRVRPNDLDKYFDSHLIDPKFIRRDRFEEFIIDRSIRILNIIEETMGRDVHGRDSDEVVVAFGDDLVGTSRKLTIK